MSITDHTLIKYMFFCTYLDLLPLNIVYFVLEKSNFDLKINISLTVGTMIMYKKTANSAVCVCVCVYSLHAQYKFSVVLAAPTL